MNEIACTGLMASSPLGALAAFGLLRIAPLMPELGGRTQLHWTPDHGDWFATLTTERAVSQDLLLDLLAARPLGQKRPEFLWREEIKNLTRDEFHGADESLLPWLTAFTAEPLRENVKAASPMDTTAAQWKWLVKLREADAALYDPSTGKKSKPDPAVVRARFHNALYHIWPYSDLGDTINWDPVTVANGAFSPQDPAKRKDTEKNCVLAAFWLAIEALPLFPCYWSSHPVARGFRYEPSAWLTWPVWETPIPVETLASLLSLPDLYRPPKGRWNAALLRARGITAAFSSRRYNPSGYYGAFSHATRLL